MRYQIENDGSVSQADTELITDQKAVLKELFEQYSWSVSNIEKDGAKYKIDVKNIHTNSELKLNVFAGNIRDEARNEKEKKIQLNGSDPRVIEQDRINIILGIYCRKNTDNLNDLIFAGWSIDENTNYPSNPSIRGINTDLLQLAKVNGFVKNEFRSNIVCVFRPEFIFYYLDNLFNIHSITTGVENQNISQPNEEHQVIFFGSPGTGKSTVVKKITNGKNQTRTTFHPETDYHSFVGSYKPVMDGKDIKYEFTPQAFTKAYCNAWLNLDEPYFLIIEEINRGNCAQIFGDIFQCLDRNSAGFSEYEIDCDNDLSKHLKSFFESNLSEEKIKEYNLITKSDNFNKLSLPQNLYILATMNTSDQSLFPMDSAFRRRWDWKFVPIDYADANSLTITIDAETTYNWGEFIFKINPKIKELTGSEDKQLGNRFISPADGKITFDQFRSKVLFYLWSEVYKDEVGTQNSIFKYSVTDSEPKDFQFGELFDNTTHGLSPQELVKAFMEFNGIEKD